MTLRTFLRVGAASAVLYGSLVAAAYLAFTGPAYPQETIVPKDAPQVASTPPLALPKAKPVVCKLPLAQLGSGRVLTGTKARQYIAAAGAVVPPEVDTVAYVGLGGDRVMVFFADETGCVKGFKAITSKVHRAVLIKAFGWVV